MKLKYYLRGFGIGIIFTAIILGILNTSKHSAISDQEIIEKAKDLGMIDPKEDILEETLAPSSGPTATVKSVVVTLTPKTKATPQPTKAPKKSANPKKTKQPQTDSATVSIVIESGMWSESVSKKLYEMGAIEDAEEFDEYLCENGYASKIRPGTYYIIKGSNYEEIANALVK